MQLPILLVIVVGGAVTTGLPQYQPHSSLQPYYKAPSLPAFSSGHEAPRIAQNRKPMYTYAEVNTPYYQYHYYSPAYMNQPAIYDASLPESYARNDVNSRALGFPTTSKSLFYPATNGPLLYPKTAFRNSGYTPSYETSIAPRFHNSLEVPITSRPLTFNNAYAPVFRTYQAPGSNRVDPSPVNPVSTPTELASAFPNIVRDRYGNDRNSENSSTYQDTNLEPDLLVPTNPKLFLKSAVVPESLATPSSTIIKDEVRRRGISPQSTFQDQIIPSLNKSYFDNSSSKTDTFTSTSPKPIFTLQNSSIPSTPDPLSGEISATILRVFSSPTLDLRQNYGVNTSVVLPTKPVFNDVDKSKPSILVTQVSAETPTGTTRSHRQKIAKKVNPSVVPKKFLPKQPNALFYSPGHDIPN